MVGDQEYDLKHNHPSMPRSSLCGACMEAEEVKLVKEALAPIFNPKFAVARAAQEIALAAWMMNVQKNIEYLAVQAGVHDARDAMLLCRVEGLEETA